MAGRFPWAIQVDDAPLVTIILPLDDVELTKNTRGRVDQHSVMGNGATHQRRELAARRRCFGLPLA